VSKKRVEKESGRSRIPRGNIEGFLARYKKLLLAFLALGSLPPLTSLVAKVGPPWPSEAETASYTTLLNLCLLAFLYANTSKTASEAKLRRRISAGFYVFSGVFAIYLLLKVLFCYNAPDWQHQVAGGFVFQPHIAAIIADDPTVGTKSLLGEALYDSTRIWEVWSVSLVRFVLLAAWLVLFAVVSAVIAYSIRLDEKRSAYCEKIQADPK